MGSNPIAIGGGNVVVGRAHDPNSVGSIPALPIIKLSNIMVLYLFAKQVVWVRIPSQLFIIKYLFLSIVAEW